MGAKCCGREWARDRHPRHGGSVNPTTSRRLRVGFATLVALSALYVGIGFAQHSTERTFESSLDGNGDVDRGVQIAPEADGITVIAADSNSWRGNGSEGPRALAELVAFDTDGTVLYYDDTHTRYWDVDPVPGTETVVEYAYADHLDAGECPDRWDPSDYDVDAETWETYVDAHGDVDACTENGVERVNLTTGEVESIWTQPTPGKDATRYHDVDRIDETRLVVADIYLDGVFVVDTETDQILWRWNASDAFSPTETGGPYPEDWTHINDVEVLADGRIMVSARNLDRVVFLTPDSHDVDSGWTLGAEDDHDLLYEQHNPDFVSESHGGPAVLVADSENNRVLEYQRTEDDGWEQTWRWRDARMQWPRDIDRLPDGHTLISDSNGDRVFEVDEEGEIVWSVTIGFPYEAERLDTPDESGDGPSARSRDLASRSEPISDRFWIAVKTLVPGKYQNGLMYVTPVWMDLSHVLAAAIGAVISIVWAGVEVRWAVRRRR